ncbi:LacI family DNA-binding transcriptional regulator [Mycolicibacterium smegmatis]|uniref:HTH-type transcriptional regulator DegA n=3 Tax=Mycolicibacterium smegmatis TaxID=1772 RepID=A0R2K1_MYCS2|nr:LacI family DNA-binding transcriptional regulator [Mycolicibacterium smegmatis]ABK70758.1 HTH-type transcriptional regulator DegA [Mycolicibacterium smegmatis MC2 155]AFP41455.1 LacI-family transcriptional regulator [Mycolicibacterium smegmatis MC2 155]AIU10179.1 LacI family transcriptional regulator [Mycolicibacterium smegmatis MC2 155]AIU16804.1 LacI family transcriptional regulator [Mycolicibacterium smegmatis]AIU23427.1 LacI family transcriptional regulator [Mycolicibacterium smegmatis]
MTESVGQASGSRATLATVAASAGVSIATVSKVLNGRADVAPATRSRVKALLAQHHYVARRTELGDLAAASADRPGPPTVELLFREDFNAYGIEVVQGLLDAGCAAGVAVVVSRRPDDEGDSDGTAQWVSDLAAAGRRAVISVADELPEADIAALHRFGLPLVVIDPLNQPTTRITSVGSTNFSGGLAATQHLLSLGHRRIAYVGGPVTAACNQARLHGYRAAMEEAGAAVVDGYVRTGDFLYDNGLREGSALLDLPEPPTAVFAASDETALGVIEAARSRGLRVPEDLSVVGFDDTQLARLSAPPLTTVRQPLREMGAVAMRTALRLADGDELDSHHVELATQLIARSSTARL